MRSKQIYLEDIKEWQKQQKKGQEDENYIFRISNEIFICRGEFDGVVSFDHLNSKLTTKTISAVAFDEIVDNLFISCIGRFSHWR